VQEALGLSHSLEDVELVFWLEFFHRLMPHVDILYNQDFSFSVKIDAGTLKHN
jgi:hypothetical protein